MFKLHSPKTLPHADICAVEDFSKIKLKEGMFDFTGSQLLQKQSKIKASKLVLTTLFSAILLTETVNGAYQTGTTFECNECISGGSISCRPDYYDRYAFCCVEDEVGSRGCGGDDVYCSGYSTSSAMNPFSCPYQNNYCGASSSELEMHPESRNNLVIDIANSQF